MKLLIVDDQKSVHLYLQKALDLAALGYTSVFHAENGVQALDIILKEQPDVMLLDIQMPVMDGLTLLDTLREKHIAIPETIILTAYDEFTYAKRCIEFGVHRYVLKPIDPDEISAGLTQLHQQLKKQQSTDCQWIFPLCCAHADQQFSSTPVPVGQLKPFPYGVLCLPDESAAQSPACCCACLVHGLYFQLIRTPSADSWAAFVQTLSPAAGCSRFYDQPFQLTTAAREAAFALWQSFYQPRVCFYDGDFFSPLGQKDALDCLMPLAESFLVEDSGHLTDCVAKAFEQLSLRRCAPSSVFFACRKLLTRLQNEHCPGRVVDFSKWSRAESFLSADTLRAALTDELLEMAQLASPSGTQSDEEAIARIHDYVAEHFGEDLSLSALSGRFFISRYQISRLFKQIYGINYQDYVLSVRMKAAARMLTHTHAKLYEISLSVGFDEPSYFSNVFKKHYGLSPRAYRAQKGVPSP